MPAESSDIVRRDYQHGKVAYAFQWNKSNHLEFGNQKGDLASLWAHLETIQSGKIPEVLFQDPFYTRASRLRFVNMSPAKKVGFRKQLKRAGSIRAQVDDDLVEKLRTFHRIRNDLSYSADHNILKEFLYHDPQTIAIEVPVWSEGYKITGHIDLIRYVDDYIQVSDYKPGSLESTNRRFLDSLPQVSAYGEMIAHHLAGTLRSALEAPLLPKIRCAIFDTHSCWHFGAELFVQLHQTGVLQDF
ncbi:MAG: PD-(D/E)XK nuclease family protein [Candidatus Thorarchaeota archaeon]|nr:PD-(D/E)XK nuclease family protein [Candidatus Thorarchaeota archaeon]